VNDSRQPVQPAPAAPATPRLAPPQQTTVPRPMSAPAPGQHAPGQPAPQARPAAAPMQHPPHAPQPAARPMHAPQAQPGVAAAPHAPQQMPRPMQSPAPVRTTPPPIPPQRPAPPPDEEAIALVEDGDEDDDLMTPPAATTPSKIKFGAEVGIKKHAWKRQLKSGGVGACRVRTFHGKLSDQGLEYVDEAINTWLDDHPEIDVKFVTTNVGMFDGKFKDLALIVNVWY
jgi:hypothetical protein